MLQKAVPLFSHLPQYERETSLSLKLKVGFSSDEIHPAILRLGLQYASGNISGSNARCVAMLTALKQFIVDYSTPPQKVMRDDLLSKLKPLVRFLIDSRPQSMSMGNAIRYVKMKISKSVQHTLQACGGRWTHPRSDGRTHSEMGDARYANSTHVPTSALYVHCAGSMLVSLSVWPRTSC